MTRDEGTGEKTLRLIPNQWIVIPPHSLLCMPWSIKPF